MTKPHGGGQKRSVTVADVAALANVSKATAARALGNYGRVNSSTRNRVRSAAAELGYLPNALARSMSTGRSNTVALVLSDIENPFFARAARAISDVVKAAGYDLVLSNTDENVENELAAVDVLLEKQVDGLIIAPASRLYKKAVQRALDHECPVVLFDRGLDGVDCDLVMADNYQGSFDVTSFLLQQGHESVAFISTLDQMNYKRGELVRSTTVSDRIDGYHRALDSYGIAEDKRIVRLDARRLGITNVAAEVLEQGATSIIASDSIIAQEVLRFAQDEGLAVPHDFSLVCFDDAPWTALTHPPITVVSQPIHELGTEGGLLLIERLRDPSLAHQRRVLSQRLILRRSVSQPHEALKISH